jgi:hypothetical protein
MVVRSPNGSRRIEHEEEVETKLYTFFTVPPERIHFAAFNNLILTGTNDFART